MKELDSVVLLRDVPGRDLRAGDSGTVVIVYTPMAVCVEFHSGSARPHALIDVETKMLRRLKGSDVFCVRPAANPRKREPIGLEFRRPAKKPSTRNYGSKIQKRRHT